MGKTNSKTRRKIRRENERKLNEIANNKEKELNNVVKKVEKEEKVTASKRNAETSPKTTVQTKGNENVKMKNNYMWQGNSKETATRHSFGDRKVEILVDFTNGAFNVKTNKTYWDENVEYAKPIRGFDSDGVYKAEYSRKMERARKNQIKRFLKRECSKTEYRIYKKSFKNIDTGVYATLRGLDKLNNHKTGYAIDYIRIMMDPYSSLSKEEAKEARFEALKRAGISVSYNVGLSNASKTLNIFDKMKGLVIANKQRNCINASIISGFKLKRNKRLLGKGESETLSEMLMEEDNEEVKVEEKKEKAKIVASINNKIDLSREKLNKVRVAASESVKGLTGTWTRKISSSKDSIKNKVHKLREDKAIGRRVIRGALTMAAVGMVVLSVNTSTGLSVPTENKTNVSKELESNISDNVTVAQIVSQTDAKLNEINNKNQSEQEVEQNAEEKTTYTNNEKPEVNNTANKKQETKSKTEGKKKSDKEKLKEFKEEAFQKYMDSFVIGKKPNVEDLLSNEKYYQSPDGTGSYGYFKTHPDYIMTRVNVIDDEGFHVVKAEGKNLNEVLKDFPNYDSYSIHFTNSKTGYGLGFMTQNQVEKMINNKINSIIKSKQAKDIER